MVRILLRILFLILILSNLKIAIAKTDTVSLNFDSVDIAIFLKTMSEITGKSFILSDKVKGNISFVSSQDVPVNMVYDIVLSILKAQGLIAIPGDNDIVHVYPAGEALKMSGRIFYGTELLTIEKDIIVTQIIPISYASAVDLLNVIRPLFPAEVIFIAYSRTNVIIANGSVVNINQLLSVIRFLDTEIARAPSDIHIYNLDNADAESVALTLNNLAASIPIKRDEKAQKPPGEPESPFGERFKVVANKETNSILIISAPQDYEKIERIIKELDVKREQVLVEALIVEITLDDDQTLGFDLNALIDTGLGTDAIISSNTGLMKESIQTGGLFGLTVGLLNGTLPSVYAILNANRENTNFRILSTPEIVTIDNQEAVITIGEQIPFLTSSRVDQYNNVISTYDYKDIGIVLKITPQINKNGYITMKINQQVKKIVEGTTLLQNPSVFNREISSKVTVRNERTIVIGGLIRDDTTNVEQKVPVLGDIPILGLLFKKETKKRVRTNLLIFITPHIITEDEAIQDITEKKRKEQDAFKGEEENR